MKIAADVHPTNEPPGLFKYLPPDKVVFFEQRLILLTPPVYLNDPWDFLPQSSAPSESDLLKIWRAREAEIERSSVIALPAEFARRARLERLDAMRADFASREFLIEQGKDFREEIGKVVGVVSFTEQPLSRLMWAHYADSHRGFVAEFEAGPSDESYGLRVRMCAVGPFVAAKVKYDPDFRRVAANAENVHEILWSKHPEWEAEREWRIICDLKRSLTGTLKAAKGVHGVQRFCLPFPPEGLRRVIFGLAMAPAVKARLCSMLDQEGFQRVTKEETYIDPVTGALVVRPF